MKDRGVQGDYIDRQFKGVEEDLDYRRKVMTPAQRDYYYAKKAEERLREKQKTLTEFQMVQDSRPLKPRGKR